MKNLQLGDIGPSVQLLQLALRREGAYSGDTSGVFGGATLAALRSFQKRRGLVPDGIAGARTQRALEPYYTGYAVHSLQRGDSIYRLAVAYRSSVAAIERANPGVDAGNLKIGERLIIPLGFRVVPTDIDWCSRLVDYACRGLSARYPFIALGEMGRSVMGKPLHILKLGTGERRVFFNAAHHANEWITTPLVLRFCEEFAAAASRGGEIWGREALPLLRSCSLYVAPCVDIDAIDLVTGEMRQGEYYEKAADIAMDFPDIPFPSGWKANIEGTDLNLQYPARWEQAREIKFAQGYNRPAPRDYVGVSPLSAPESRAVQRFTLDYEPDITLSFHTQGDTIYWKFLDYEPEGSRALAEAMGEASGYAVEETPYASGFAGYKDWFIQDFNRPGYTIECGTGVSPLPISDFESIYDDCLGIMTLALTGTES